MERAFQKESGFDLISRWKLG